MSHFIFQMDHESLSYLGLKLSQEIEEMPSVNLEPALQKVQSNLDKWGKLKLTLWGKINVIKTVVAPQLNYIAMMLYRLTFLNNMTQ